MISNLQALRGLAALAVVFYHTAFTFNRGVHTEFMAISVFFVISGFIMTHITREQGDAKYFLIQRLIRIVPMYWISTLTLIALTAALHSGHTWENLTPESVAKSLFFVSYLNKSGEHHPLLAVGWTLNMEMFFYLTFAAMLAVSRRYAPLLVCLALVAARAAAQQTGCTAVACDVYLNSGITYFVSGIAVYYIWIALERHAQARPLPVAIGGAAVVLLFLAANAHPDLANDVQNFLVVPLGILLPPLLVATLLLLHSANFKITWAPLVILGNASYVLYLTHTIVMPAIAKTSSLFFAFDPKENVLAMLFMLTACTAVAIFTHYKIEQPILRFLHGKFPAKPA